ncbi:MAG: hypothetical protein FJ086_11775 [Deltaproteobacteria bacterium]|nr:hypothetical protein [Deltaproteobacteria bacterium]
MAGCGNCGKAVPVVGNQVGRRDTCPHCEAELHSCQSCRHFDESVAKGCKEPFAEVPDDRLGGNFCDFFQIGDGVNRGGPDKASLMSAAEALFKK